MTLIYITCKNDKEAVKISRHLLKKRLIACSNIFPIKSMYWWNKKIINDRETAMLIKTKEKNYNRVAIEVKKIHSYDIPCILRLDSESNKEYNNWVNRVVR